MKLYNSIFSLVEDTDGNFSLAFRFSFMFPHFLLNSNSSWHYIIWKFFHIPLEAFKFLSVPVHPDLVFINKYTEVTFIFLHNRLSVIRVYSINLEIVGWTLVSCNQRMHFCGMMVKVLPCMLTLTVCYIFINLFTILPYTTHQFLFFCHLEAHLSVSKKKSISEIFICIHS